MRFATDLKAYSFIYPNLGNKGLHQHVVDMASYSKFSLKLPTYRTLQMSFLEPDFEPESGNRESVMIKCCSTYDLDFGTLLIVLIRQVWSEKHCVESMLLHGGADLHGE